MLRQPVKKFTILASTTVGAANYNSTVNASAVQLPESDFTSITYVVTATAVAGSNPTADVYLQTSPDGGTTWWDMVHFTQITAASATNIYAATIAADDNTRVVTGSLAGTTLSASVVGVNHLGRLVNVIVTIGGSATPTVTLKIDAYINSLQPH